MDINLPTTVAEIQAEFDRYEAALIGNDVEALANFFWRDPRATRLAPGGGLYGYDEIEAFRRARDASDVTRVLERVTIIGLGADCGVATAEYRRTGSGRRGAQSQTWVKFAEGWRIVAAHVSLEPAQPSET